MSKSCRVWRIMLIGWGALALAGHIRAAEPAAAATGRAAALTALKAAKAQVELDDQGHVLRVSASGRQFDDAALAQVAALPELETLDLSGTAVTDAGTASLAGLKELQRLYLRGTKITDASLAHLAGLTNLEVLALQDTAVDGSGLASLKGLANLEVLNLAQTKVTDDRLAAIEGLAEPTPSACKARPSAARPWPTSNRWPKCGS